MMVSAINLYLIVQKNNDMDDFFVFFHKSRLFYICLVAYMNTSLLCMQLIC
jgi:hypothetical protein